MPGSHSSVEADYVNLCTSTKTYQIRQVQSSNSIILARPSLGDINPGTLEQGDGDGDAMEQDDTAFGSLDTVTAIAQCKATLEVYKSEDGLPSAIAFLERTLPVYDHLVVEDDDVNMAMNTTSATMTDIEKMKLAKEAVLNDVPLSQAECESGWIEICAFVHAGGKVGKQASSWRPSAKTKLEVWKKTLEASVLQGIELDKQFLVKDLWKAVTDEDEEEPPFQKSLLEAVIRRLMDEQSLEASKGSDSALKCKCTRVCSMNSNAYNNSYTLGANLDKDISVRWAAETYLDAAAPTSATAIPRKEFLTAWGDHLPEVWRSEASWANLKVRYFSSMYFDNNRILDRIFWISIPLTGK